MGWNHQPVYDFNGVLWSKIYLFYVLGGMIFPNRHGFWTTGSAHQKWISGEKPESEALTICWTEKLLVAVWIDMLDDVTFQGGPLKSWQLVVGEVLSVTVTQIFESSCPPASTGSQWKSGSVTLSPAKKKIAGLICVDLLHCHSHLDWWDVAARRCLKKWHLENPEIVCFFWLIGDCRMEMTIYHQFFPWCNCHRMIQRYLDSLGLQLQFRIILCWESRKKPWFPGGNVLLWLESPGYDAGSIINALGRGLAFHVSGSWPCFASHGLEANVSESLWCCKKNTGYLHLTLLPFSMYTYVYYVRYADRIWFQITYIYIYIWYLSMVHHLVEIVNTFQVAGGPSEGKQDGSTMHWRWAGSMGWLYS